jgi:hypothetical protein
MISKTLEHESGLAQEELSGTDDEMSAAAHDEITRLAFSYWEARGNQGGSPWEDWFRAEEELKRRREL